ncbi:MAG: hypothetical protein PSX71_03610 [bacterium]|nr:hypothetical protein [bacterium]
MKIMFVIPILAIIFFGAASANVPCDLSVSQAAIDRGDYPEAYRELKKCREFNCKNSVVYGQLAYLVSIGFGSYASEKERFSDVFWLYLHAAVLGSDDGIRAIKSIFKSGNSLLGVEKNLTAAMCLERLEGKSKTSDEVRACLPEPYAKQA